MIYVVSDIFGDFNKYKAVFTKVKDSDFLFVLGNVIGYGKQSVKILQDMMYRENVYPVLGAQEFMALPILKNLIEDKTKEQIKDQMEDMLHWFEHGGKKVIDDFKKLKPDDREALVDYLEEFVTYEEVTVKKVDYILVHAGIANFDPQKSPEDYSPDELVNHPADYSKQYYDDITVITGCTPVADIPQNGGQNQTFKGNGHIAINGDLIGGNPLALYCIDNGRTFYL